MRREIKFRAWNKVRNEMFTNAICNAPDNFEMILKHPQIYDVMQYTGLKDKNGVEIYEGDIVKSDKRGAAFYRSVVIYNSLNSRFDVETMGCMFPMIIDAYLSDITINGFDYEVIGNIYENPELLEGGWKE